MAPDVSSPASLAPYNGFGFSEKVGCHYPPFATGIRDYPFESIHLPYVP